MPDKRCINERENKIITLPSSYDNYYRQLVLPYTYQNINNNIITSNTAIIASEIAKGLKGLEDLHWIRAISQEYYEDELTGTFEYDIFKEYEKIIQEYYECGNWDLTLNPGVTITDTSYELYENSILYPQAGLYWNSFYNKYFAIWYSPIQRYKNNEILSKEDAENYIKNVLSKTSSYINNDNLGIILRVTDELGFSPIDVISVDTTPTERVKSLLKSLKLWSIALNEAQNNYQTLKEICYDNKFKKQYLFLDEDVNLFGFIKKTYFVFKIEKEYFGDLTGDASLVELPSYWSDKEDYNSGDYVLGSRDEDKNFLYRCVRSHKAIDGDGTFQQKITVKKKLTGSEQTYDQIVDQWVLISTDYAKELEAIEKAYAQKGEKEFNPQDWVRFVFPALEDEKLKEYYPNGTVKPSTQHGTVYWGAENGITLRPIVHKYIKEEDKEKYADKEEEPPISTKVDYYSLAISEIDETDPSDPHLTPMDKEAEMNFSSQNTSPSQAATTFIDTSRKIIHYFKKSTLPLVFYMSMDVKLEGIGADAFADRLDILKVVCRSALTNIGSRAFYNCSNLKQAVLSKNLMGIGIKAFAACTSLKRASIPPRVSRLQGCYIGCTSLQSVTLSNNTIELGDSTFANCTSLEHIYNTKNLIKLGTGVFNNCSSLKAIFIPKKVTELPARLFKNCKNAIITIENNKPTLLGESCFEGCEQLTEAVSFENLTELYNSTYKNCINLKRIVFNLSSESTNKIVPANFCYGCHQLREIDLVDVTELGDKSFQNCAMLSEVRIPQTVKFVGSNVFYDCFRLGKVRVPTNHPTKHTSWIEGILDSTNRTNWVDPLFTTVMTYNGVILRWQLTTI